MRLAAWGKRIKRHLRHWNWRRAAPSHGGHVTLWMAGGLWRRVHQAYQCLAPPQCAHLGDGWARPVQANNAIGLLNRKPSQQNPNLIK